MCAFILNSKEGDFIPAYNESVSKEFSQKLSTDEIVHLRERYRHLFPERVDDLDMNGIDLTPDTPAVLLSVVPLRFFFDATAAHVGGRVIIKFIVEKDGVVKDAVIIGVPDKYFDEEALRCIRQWKFKPALKKGNACGCVLSIPFVFGLSPFAPLGRPRY